VGTAQHHGCCSQRHRGSPGSGPLARAATPSAPRCLRLRGAAQCRAAPPLSGASGAQGVGRCRRLHAAAVRRAPRRQPPRRARRARRSRAGGVPVCRGGRGGALSPEPCLQGPSAGPSPERRPRGVGDLLLHWPWARAQNDICVPQRLPLVQVCSVRSRAAPRLDGAAGGCGRRLLMQAQQGGRCWGASGERRQERA